MASKKHRYSELPGFRDMEVPRGFKNRDLRGLYMPRVTVAKLPLHSIVGQNSVTEWYSPAPRREAAVASDLGLMVLCKEHNL